MAKKSIFHLPDGEGFYWKRDYIYLTIRVAGERFQYTTGFMGNEPGLLVKLRQFKQAKIAEATEQSQTKIARGVRMEDVFNTYLAHLRKKEDAGDEYAKTGRKTSDRTESVIRCHLGGFFNKLKPEQVKGKLDQYEAQRKQEGVGAPTFNGELRILRAALRRGMKKSLLRLVDVPLEFPFNYDGERKAKRKGIITPKQEACIMKEAAEHLKPVFAMAIMTGIRPKEMRFIRPEQVFFDAPKNWVSPDGEPFDPHIMLRDGETKNGDGRKVGLIDELIPILKDWQKKTKTDHSECKWFFHHNGKQLGEWKTVWHNALVKCGLRVQNDEGKWENTVIFYDSRRTARTRLGDIGVSKEDAKRQLGHKDDNQSDDYNQSTAHVKRIREAHKPAKAKAPKASIDWKADLKELKQQFDGGFIPEDLYKAEVAKVLASR